MDKSMSPLKKKNQRKIGIPEDKLCKCEMCEAIKEVKDEN